MDNTDWQGHDPNATNDFNFDAMVTPSWFDDEAQVFEFINGANQVTVWTEPVPQGANGKSREPIIKDLHDPRKPGFMRQDLLAMFKDAYLFVEKRVTDILWGARARFPTFYIENEGLLEWFYIDAKRGQDPGYMLETNAWHLILRIASVIHPSRFDWYPKNQRMRTMTLTENILNTLEYGPCLDCPCRKATLSSRRAITRFLTYNANNGSERTFGWEESLEDFCLWYRRNEAAPTDLGLGWNAEENGYAIDD